MKDDHVSRKALPVVSVTMGGPAEFGREIRETTPDWTWRDRVGHWMVRWGIGRKNYTVPPGLYRLGSPETDVPVLVSANYKLTFDVLRRSLAGRSAWILILDTAGINVWCAAGKGTFGTEELLRCITMSDLARVVSGRTLVVPQLGAPGIAAHEVKKRSGFKVVFGPVRAGDLPRFLDAGLKADREMRLVTFTLPERMVLLPMELVPALKWSLPVLLPLWIIGGWGWWGYSLQALFANALNLTLAFAGGIFAGAVAAPLLLPWLPGRSFSLKGALTGIAWSLLFLIFLRGAVPGLFPSPAWEGAVWILSLPALSAFLALNFTGSSTLTSLSGVQKEFRTAVPLQVAAGSLGLALWIAGHFFRGGILMPVLYLENVTTLRLDRSACTGCRLCTIVCPRGVYEMHGKKARIVERDACIECGACALNCAFGAIDVRSGVGCAAAIINSKLGRHDACCVIDEEEKKSPSCC